MTVSMYRLPKCILIPFKIVNPSTQCSWLTDDVDVLELLGGDDVQESEARSDGPRGAAWLQ